MALIRHRAAAIAASLAIAASFVAAALPASAQTCPYNSTQGTCSCPTSGAGATCFGGQLYRSTDSTCQNDVRPCAANQQFSCASVSCTCNVAAYPCGGCTAASSTAGASCSSPTGGQYTNQCGTCACPAGKTLCPSSNSCILNRSCPAGTTWDPCTDTCGTPNVLLSPGFVQNGFIDVAGDWRNRGGNLRLDYANGAGMGDLYMASGKSLRVDGAGVTTLNVANFGSGGTGLDVNFPSGTQLCFGASCRASWPSSADFDPAYLNASGDTMSGLLTLGGGLRMASGAGAGKFLMSDASGNGSWQTLTALTGSGTTGRLPKFTGATSLGDSVATDYGFGLGIAGTAAAGGYGLTVSNNGQGGGIDVSSNSPLNGIATLRVRNSGAGGGIEVDGGSSGNGAFIKGSGANVALEAASYNYPGANAVGTIVQVRRGPGSGVAPAAGMGARIGFPLQGDSAGSYNQGGGLGAVVEVASPWKTGLFFETVNGFTMSEKMRLTGDGRLGIGTATPGAMLTVNGGSAAIGTSVTASGSNSLAVGSSASATGATSVAIGQNAAASGASSAAIGYYTTANNSYATALGVSSQATGQYSIALGDGAIAGGYASSSLGFMSNASGGNSVAIGTRADATNTGSIAIGGYNAATGNSSISIGNGIDVNRKMTVAGTAAIGLGSGSDIPTLVVTSAPNTAGTYGKVGIGTSAPSTLLDIQGWPNNSAIKLAGSYIGDNWDGVLHMQSGGGVVSFDGGDSVGIGTTGPSQKLQVVGGGAYGLGVVCGNGQCFHFNNNGWIYAGDTSSNVYGGVGVAAQNLWAQSAVYINGDGRSAWPSLSTTTSYCQFNAGSGAGWKACYCPGGYAVTGWYGYNCKNNGGDWECSSSAPYGSTAVQIYHDSAGTAYVWAQCARVN